LRLPNLMLPPLMSNHGNYVVSLGNVAVGWRPRRKHWGRDSSWLAAVEVLFDGNGAVAGVATGDMGVAKDATKICSPAAWSSAKYTLFAEGARGSLSKTCCNASVCRRPRAAKVRHRAERAVAGRAGQDRRAWCSTPSAGRSIAEPARLVPLSSRCKLVSVGFVVQL
jgi:hypothetical protein